MLIAALAPEPAVEEPERPFFERGGVHLILIQASHSIALATVFAVYSDAGPYVPMSTGERVAGTVGIVAGVNLAAVLMARYLRPSVGVAWLTAVLSLASVVPGLELGWQSVLHRRPRREVLDPDYAVSMLLSASLGVVSSFIGLVPQDRGRLHFGTTALLAGATATLGVVTMVAFMDTNRHEGPRAAAALVPLCGALVLRVLQSVFLPDLFVAPTVVPGGAGLSFSTAW